MKTAYRNLHPVPRLSQLLDMRLKERAKILRVSISNDLIIIMEHVENVISNPAYNIIMSLSVYHHNDNNMIM